MTGEVEVVAWRVRPRGDVVWHLTDDPRTNCGYEREPLVPASALEALRADNERLVKERDGLVLALVAEKEHQALRRKCGPECDAEGDDPNCLLEGEMMRLRDDALDRAERAEATLATRDAEIAKAVAEEREQCRRIAREVGNVCNELQNDNVDREANILKRDTAFRIEMQISARAQEPRS